MIVRKGRAPSQFSILRVLHCRMQSSERGGLPVNSVFSECFAAECNRQKGEGSQSASSIDNLHLSIASQSSERGGPPVSFQHRDSPTLLIASLPNTHLKREIPRSPSSINNLHPFDSLAIVRKGEGRAPCQLQASIFYKPSSIALLLNAFIRKGRALSVSLSIDILQH